MKNDLIDSSREIDRNAYGEYDAFNVVVYDLAASRMVLKRFANFCESPKEVGIFDNPYVLMENCRLDLVVPCLDFDGLVLDRANKEIVAEGFL